MFFTAKRKWTECPVSHQQPSPTCIGDPIGERRPKDGGTSGLVAPLNLPVPIFSSPLTIVVTQNVALDIPRATLGGRRPTTRFTAIGQFVCTTSTQTFLSHLRFSVYIIARIGSLGSKRQVS